MLQMISWSRWPSISGKNGHGKGSWFDCVVQTKVRSPSWSHWFLFILCICTTVSTSSSCLLRNTSFNVLFMILVALDLPWNFKCTGTCVCLLWMYCKRNEECELLSEGNLFRDKKLWEMDFNIIMWPGASKDAN